jgi:uncharacterized protein
VSKERTEPERTPPGAAPGPDADLRDPNVPDESSDSSQVDLDTALERLSDTLNPMTRGQIDGFLAAMLVCPRSPQPEEWMPVLWGGEPGDETPESVPPTLLPALRRRLAGIEAALRENSYRPELDAGAGEGTGWYYWATGFGIALAHYPGGWAGLGATAARTAIDCLEDLSRLALGIDLDPARAVELEAVAPALIAEGITLLYDEVLRLEFAALLDGRPGIDRPPSPVRLGRKIGRNDICLCGSGQAYRTCCGR